MVVNQNVHDWEDCFMSDCFFAPEANEMALSLSPKALRILVATPSGMAAVLYVPDQGGGTSTIDQLE